MATAAASPVGRAEELAAIAGFLEAGAPACVVVEGEPGIGKSTVWDAALADAERLGFRALTAQPAASEAKLAFSALTDLLDGVIDDALPTLPAPQRRALEAALLLEETGGTRPDRRAVSAGVLSLLRALAGDEPLLLAIDDAQWLDASSAAALAFAARRLREEPVALLLARRARGGDDRGTLEQAMPDERRLVVALGPLGFIELNALLHARLGTVLSRPLLHRIHDLSGGNPFFALELARAPELVERGHGLPPTLDALVRGRLAALPDEARHGLFAAAASSQPTVELVERVVGISGVLAPAEADGIVELAHGSVRFEHPLLASAAYEAAEPARRRDVHRQLADLVADPEERAAHLAAAATGPDETVAAALDQAAGRARARGAPAAAAELGEQAALLTPPEDTAAARRRLADAGYHHFESGDGRRALELLGSVAGELPAGRERADGLCRLARVRSYCDDLGGATDLFLDAAEEAGDDRLTKARALEGAATQLFRRRRRLDEAVAHAEAAAALARELGDEALLAEALGSQLLAEATLGRPEARETLEEALVHQPAAASDRILAQPKWAAAIARMWWDEPHAVRETYEELADRGRETGDEGSLAYVYVMLAQADCLLGDFGRARRDADAAREIAEQAGQEMLVAYGLAVGALVDAHCGLAEDCRATAADALELARKTDGTPALQLATTALGLLELSLGRSAEAAATLEPAIGFARSEDICEPGLTRYVVDGVEAMVELGRLDDARAALDWHESNATRLGRRSALASSWRCRGLLAAGEGRVDEAIPSFEHALAEHEAVPFPFDRARTLLALGAALRRAKRKADARRTLERAVAELERLDAAAFAERARSELGRIGGRRPAADDALTATEQQIAELVAQGRSNKEVAAALFVTVKTVEANLSKVYAKLGIRSRAALARRLEREEPAVKP